MRTRVEQRAGLGEAFVVWGLCGIVGVEILVTYARLPASELYHVSGSGLEGGASRALVFLDFPVALAAVPLAVLAAARLGGRRAALLAALAVALCAVTAVPGVVDQGNLDAKPVNALPALGVALALVLTVAAAARWGAALVPRLPGDRIRLGLAVLLLLASPPWLAADLGLSFDRVPVLGWLWQTGELRRDRASGLLGPVVHHGHHHGVDGLLLALGALLLSRGLAAMPASRLRALLAAYLALMLVYGLANLANDFWLEQVVERGWTGWEIPSVLRPAATPAWGALAGIAAVLWLGWALSARSRAG